MRTGRMGVLKQRMLLRSHAPLYAFVLAMAMALLFLLPVGPASRLIPEALAHALPVRSEPAQGAILRKPPSQVHIWFDDALVTANSHMSVLDPKGNEVDKRDSYVGRSNPREMSVTLAKLPAGTYTVLWVAQSADDGHITEGSFVFSVTLPDGTVPPLPAGASSAGGGTSTGTSFVVNGPILLQALATWLALLSMTFWVGGLIWETWVLTPGASDDPSLARASWVASRRFRRLVPYALGTVLLADVAMVLGQAAALTGNWSSAIAPSSLHSMLFGSHFGLFWWMREAIVPAALGLWGLSAWHGWSPWRVRPQEAANAPTSANELQPIPDWWQGVLQVVRGIPHLPAQLLAGWQRSSWVGRAQVLLGAALLVAFAFSGHAAAVPPSELGFSLSVDLLHLVGNAAWVGGLLYIGVVLVPSLRRLGTNSRARVLARGLPVFSVLAATSAVVLAATGPLNATVHMTSWQQFLTTPYGWTLAVKVECFLLMVAISAYHAFYLRPRLVQALTSSRVVIAIVSGRALVQMAPSSRSEKARAAPDASETPLEIQGNQGDESDSERIQRLTERLEGWLQREAALGVAVLLCVALLSVVFAGTLVPPM
jgi:copper transport protein